jgi:hypothetical protein
MFTARLAGNRAELDSAFERLQGATRVAELLRRTSVSLRLPAGAEVAMRCEARWLKAGDTLAEAGVAAGSVVFLCVGECGGMPGTQIVGADPETQEAAIDRNGEELVGSLDTILGQLSHEVSEMAVTVQRLQCRREPSLLLQQAVADPTTSKVCTRIYEDFQVFLIVINGNWLTIRQNVEGLKPSWPLNGPPGWPLNGPPR